MVQGSRVALVSEIPAGKKNRRLVLIVDDSPEDRVAQRRYLERSEDPHYEVIEAEMGEAGVRLCFDRLPDCVLLDYGLPDMQGVEFLQRLSVNAEGPLCPVVILTGALNEGTAIEALKAGAHDYLVKGRVTREALGIAIESAIEKASLQRQVRETQARLRTALDTMLDCFAIFGAIRDADGAVVDFSVEYANDCVCAEARLSREAIHHRPLAEVLSVHRRPELYQQYLEVLRNGESVAREIVLHDADDPSPFPEVVQAWDIRITKVEDGVAVAWRDITEHKSAESYVYRMNGVLERRVEERTSALQDMIRELEGFTYTVAHDLRAPLRAIIATSRILLEEASDKLSPEHQKMLNRQAANSQRLGDLIDDLLRLSRISRHEMRRAKVDISALSEEVVASARDGGSGPMPEFKIAPGLVACGDEILLRLALVNLIENAVKFSPKGGVIEIGGYEDGERIVVFVRDQGIGFDMQYAHKLFAPFERLHRESEFPGTGIGLANVQRIVQRHGGTVWAESSLGHGATFYMALPRVV